MSLRRSPPHPAELPRQRHSMRPRYAPTSVIMRRATRASDGQGAPAHLHIGLGKKAIELAARVADDYVCVHPEGDFVRQYRESEAATGPFRAGSRCAGAPTRPRRARPCTGCGPRPDPRLDHAAAAAALCAAHPSDHRRHGQRPVAAPIPMCTWPGSGHTWMRVRRGVCRPSRPEQDPGRSTS
jgi:hypothetical protein